MLKIIGPEELVLLAARRVFAMGRKARMRGERCMDLKLMDGSAETPRNMALEAPQLAAAAARHAAPTGPVVVAR